MIKHMNARFGKQRSSKGHHGMSGEKSKNSSSTLNSPPLTSPTSLSAKPTPVLNIHEAAINSSIASCNDLTLNDELSIDAFLMYKEIKVATPQATPRHVKFWFEYFKLMTEKGEKPKDFADWLAFLEFKNDQEKVKAIKP